MIPNYAWVLRQLSCPPGELVRKVVRRFRRTASRRRARRTAERFPTYLAEAPDGALSRYVDPPMPETLADCYRERMLVADLYLDHRFDLLGSGWVKVDYGRDCTGLNGHRYAARDFPVSESGGKGLAERINRANLGEALRLWRKLDVGYEMIDWQLDFKSGYRWDESRWYVDVAIPFDCRGADVKVPWELARCQHLPQLALAYAACREVERATGERYAREFRNQILDFIANNPPGFGVNWLCTMDVAIRIANWLIARDLFIASGATFDDDFEAVFLRSVIEHGRHIVGNPEWSERARSNHYLSDVVGLLIVAAYLPRSAETDSWAGWALREFLLEVDEQFDEDGCNREGSTSYHRLSGELVVYGAAFACRLLHDRPGIGHAGCDGVVGLAGWGGRAREALARAADELARNELPDWFWRRLAGIGRFIAALTRPDGTMPQIGDNDSGRFIKLQTMSADDCVDSMRRRYAHLDAFDELDDSMPYPRVSGLDHRHLLSALGAFFSGLTPVPANPADRIEAAMLRSIACIERRQTIGSPAVCRLGEAGVLEDCLAQFDATPADYRQRYEFKLPEAASPTCIAAEGFAGFGLFVWRLPGFYLAFRCGPSGQYGQGSHLHHDQLALELSIDGNELIRDPGTFVYTPLPALREAYRSLHAHFVPWPIGEVAAAHTGNLFAFNNVYRAECLYFNTDGIVGRHFGFGDATYRIVNCEDGKLVVRDYSKAVRLERCSFDNNSGCFCSPPFSDNYGWQRR